MGGEISMCKCHGTVDKYVQISWDGKIVCANVMGVEICANVMGGEISMCKGHGTVK